MNNNCDGDNSNIPFVGQIVSYHPSDNERHAAMVVQVHPTTTEARPQVNLLQFKPEGGKDNGICFIANCKPTDTDDPAPILKGTWCFAHEFNVEADEDDEDVLGTQTNQFVGTLQLI